MGNAARPSPVPIVGPHQRAMLELNPNDDYFEGMPEILFNARKGFQTARRI